MANTPHKSTEAQREVVQALAGFGVIEDDIAKYIGVCPKTLRKYYRNELDTAEIGANLRVARRLFQHATGDSVPAAIFWMKVRAGWKETAKVEHSGPDGTPIQTVAMTKDELRETVASVVDKF